MAEIKLKNPSIHISSRLAFYDGILPTVDGVVTIPHGRTSWAGSAFQRGFKVDAETGRTLTFSEIIRRVKTSAAPVVVEDEPTPDPVTETTPEVVGEPVAEPVAEPVTEVEKPKPVRKPRKTTKRKRATK